MQYHGRNQNALERERRHCGSSSRSEPGIGGTSDRTWRNDTRRDSPCGRTWRNDTRHHSTCGGTRRNDTRSDAIGTSKINFAP